MAFTGKAFDFEIRGPGFFSIKSPDGKSCYTRWGSFQKRPDGRLQNSKGYILDSDLHIPHDAYHVRVFLNGFVEVLSKKSNTPKRVGRMELVCFINPAGLKEVEKNIFTTSDESGQAIRGNPSTSNFGTLIQGYLEDNQTEILDEMILHTCQELSHFKPPSKTKTI